MKSTTPQPPFADATEEEVLQALGNSEINSPLGDELKRILNVYFENCAIYLRTMGRIPESFLKDTPRTALERVALSMIREAVAEDGNMTLAWQGQEQQGS
jgi:hypothetical protein